MGKHQKRRVKAPNKGSVRYWRRDEQGEIRYKYLTEGETIDDSWILGSPQGYYYWRECPWGIERKRIMRGDPCIAGTDNPPWIRGNPPRTPEHAKKIQLALLETHRKRREARAQFDETMKVLDRMIQEENA